MMTTTYLSPVTAILTCSAARAANRDGAAPMLALKTPPRPAWALACATPRRHRGCERSLPCATQPASMLVKSTRTTITRTGLSAAGCTPHAAHEARNCPPLDVVGGAGEGKQARARANARLRLPNPLFLSDETKCKSRQHILQPFVQRLLGAECSHDVRTDHCLRIVVKAVCFGDVHGFKDIQQMAHI